MNEDTTVITEKKNRRTMSVTIQPDLWARIKLAAQAENRSTSSYVEHALTRFLAAQDLTR